MYTILLDETNELKTSIRERIMQRSKLVDSLHFLVDANYKGIDMSDFTVVLEYVSPISKEYHTEILTKSDELYKDKLEYTLPFDTALTREAGDIEIQLTFSRLILNEDGKNVQQVRKTSPTTIKILPITAWSDIVPDSALTAIDQRILMTQAMIEQLGEISQQLDDTKADNIVFDKDAKTLQLTSHGELIGDQIQLSGLCSGIAQIAIDEDGNLVATYADGHTETVGKINSSDCVGVYIPEYTEDHMLVFTLQDKAGEKQYQFDIDSHNDWNELEDNGSTSDYIWQEL